MKRINIWILSAVCVLGACGLSACGNNRKETEKQTEADRIAESRSLMEQSSEFGTDSNSVNGVTDTQNGQQQKGAAGRALDDVGDAGRDLIDGAGDVGRDVIDGVGDAGRDLVDGAEDLGDAVTTPDTTAAGK